MTVKALIVEDEVAAAGRMIKMLGEICPEIDVVKITDSILSTVEWLTEHPAPDLIILDIHLSDGLCFTIFDQITIKSPVIFTTAYDKYAIKAFKLNSIDYLLKPVKRDELLFSVRRFMERRNPVPDFSFIMEHIRKIEASRWQQRFIVQFADKLKSVDVKDIAYFAASDKSVFLVSMSGPGYAIDYTLERLESVLDPDSFFRINRKFIVTLKSILSMSVYSRSRIKLELSPGPDTDVIVSSERTPDFKAWLNK